MNREEILVLLAEELPALLQPTTAKLLGDVQAYMNEVVHPLADRMASYESVTKEDPVVNTDATTTENQEQVNDSAEEPKQTTEEVSAMPEDATLLNRVKVLEQQLADAAKLQQEQAKVASDLRFSSALSTELDKLSPVHKGTVQELLANRLRSNSEEKETGWLTKDGKTLAEDVSAFFASPEGQHFLPTKHVNGVGATETSQPKTGDKIDLESAIMAAFL